MQSCSFNCNVTCVDIDTLPPMQARVIVTERPDPNVDDSTIIRTFPCLQHTSILCHTIIIGSHCKLHLVTAEVTYSLSQPDRAYLAISEVCAREAGDGVHVSVRLAIMSPLARLRELQVGMGLDTKISVTNLGKEIYPSPRGNHQRQSTPWRSCSMHRTCPALTTKTASRSLWHRPRNT